MIFIRFKTKYGGHSKFHRNLRQYAHQALEDLRNCNNKEDLDKAINSINLKLVEICKCSYHLKKQEINKPLKLFKTWSDRHGLEISKEKTQFLVLRNLRRGPPFTGETNESSAPKPSNTFECT
ncbi:hypothetical protein AVEN_50530-1 [Araneus ventricosus]|uniref:Uncharacterized protein n=1 Tax=Araneus ventricosus TaxID=182803 RepID=A0A4Y2ARX9_ARAVE|nr:hypothetical protein AVEN_50530-1 [Araneus ventricosus]